MNSSDTNLENQNTEIKNSKKSNKVLIVILILIILGLGGYICYDKLIMKEDSNNVVENKEEDKNVNIESEKDDKIKEVIVSDPKVISTLTEKVELLIDNENFHNYKERWTIYTDLNLSDATKLLIALNNSNSFQYDANYPENEIYDSVLTKTSIENIYEEIWGEEIKKFENFDYCPSYEYSNEKEEYHIAWRCGDVFNDQLLSYISKVTESEGVYYLYQSIGMVDHIDDDFNWVGKLYDSVDMKNVIDEDESAESFEITKDNYTKFSEYRFTFKLDDSGVYKITNIERLK